MCRFEVKEEFGTLGNRRHPFTISVVRSERPRWGWRFFFSERRCATSLAVASRDENRREIAPTIQSGSVR
jgi:hypothetical protein